MKRRYDNYTKATKIYENGLQLITFENLGLLAAYGRRVLGYGDVRTEKLLIKYCSDCEENYSPISGSEMLYSALRSSKNRVLRDVEEVDIFQEEIQELQKTKDFKAQVFLLSCLIYSKANYPNSKNYYINIHSLKDILDLSGMRMSLAFFIKNHYFLIKAANLVKHKPRPYFKLLIPRITSGEPVLKINDFKNVYRQYVDFVGGEIVYCKKCGVKVEKKSRNNKYCKDCSKELIMERDRIRKRG